ncbi:MAG: oxidoreductase [Lachnospiraceae bacterium]|nr:oxidoreductase [Lachnospiraceae bacterium]
MRQIQTFTSTYTADVSGVPSALYELGGMSIMHDASGCNSTYNTHDEPRYYDSKSMVFITGLSEMEAIMGDDQKLVNDIIKAAKELKPRFIAIAGTPIPMITGCDIEANARVIESETKIPTFGINTNGMHSYVEGAGEALLHYAKAFVKKNAKKKKNSVNILGATPIDFSVNGQIESIKKFLESNGIKVISNFALGCDIDEMANAGEASVNLVVSSVGIKVAEYLQNEFNTPYIVGVPYGNQMKQDLLNAIVGANSSVGASTASPLFLSDIGNKFKNEKIYIIGESVTSKSLAKYIYYKFGHIAKVISAVELGNTYHGDIVKNLKVRDSVALEKFDLHIEDEDNIAETIKDAKIVIADPLYRPIVPDKSIFVNHPHEGFSGRLFRKNIINLIDALY